MTISHIKQKNLTEIVPTRFTMTVDVDVYDAEGEKVDIEELPGESNI